MRGRGLLAVAAGGGTNLLAATGLVTGATPVTGCGCWAASLRLASGDKAWYGDRERDRSHAGGRAAGGDAGAGRGS